MSNLTIKPPLCLAAKAVVGLKMMQNASKSSDDASAPAPAASFSSPKSSSSVNVKGSHEEKKPVAGGKVCVEVQACRHRVLSLFTVCSLVLH